MPAMILALLLSLFHLCASEGGALPDPSPAQFFTISLQVDPRKEECLYLDVAQGSEVEALIMVYRGGKLDVEFRVLSPSGASLYQQLIFSNLDAEGRELPTIVKKGPKFTASEEGVHTFCFNNQMAKWTAKVLTFDVTVRAPSGGEATTGAADVVKAPAGGAAALVPAGSLTTQEGADRSALQHLGSLRRFSDRFLSLLVTLEQDLQYHRLRSQRHHATLLSTEWRVSSWSSAETTTVLLCAVFQVWLVRRWFSDGAPQQHAAAASHSASVGGPSGSFSARGAAADLLGQGFTPRKGV